MEYKGWKLLQDSFLPLLSAALSELHLCTATLGSTVDESVPCLCNFSENNVFGKGRIVVKINWSENVQPTQVLS